MTKKELAHTLSEETGIPQIQVKEIVQRVFDGIIDILVEKGRIELRNFGVFGVRKRKSKQARNPRTGEKVKVPARMVVSFKPGREMQDRVRQLKKVPGKVTGK